ncbi:Sporulation related domain protein [Methylobrevis pamukkalensis]|uniref:Sporulation related domain protein n=1 Tax=Methylobrevis pamukkalensis TaxID=1439726 RepID=A0A1E3GYW5_9HYPH|nr:Sporulation related domain protein [Methylobrevis pamukkalensis]
MPNEEQARSTFARMQSRYGSVLGGLQADIQRADLGAKGVFYRVRVGPMSSREEAARVCSQLKSAGGDCLVTR